MTTKRTEDMTADETLDAIFGEGSAAKLDAAQKAEQERIDMWTNRPCTEAGVLKAWMMTAVSGNRLTIELSELSAAGFPSIPPERITVALDTGFDVLKVYRRSLISPTQHGDIGAWIYTPNLPEGDAPAEIHIFND